MAGEQRRVGVAAGLELGDPAVLVEAELGSGAPLAAGLLADPGAGQVELVDERQLGVPVDQAVEVEAELGLGGLGGLAGGRKRQASR